MTKRTNHIGYINERLYTDVKSYEVFEENGKMMAVEVEKVQACKPEFISGGFVARCVNMHEVWSGKETKEVGTPFQLTKNRKGEWGYKGYDVLFNLSGHGQEWVEQVKKDYEGNTNVGLYVGEFEDNAGHYYINVYAVTKTGKPRTKFRKLGQIEKECEYFYDFNF